MEREEEPKCNEMHSLYEAYNELHSLAQELETPFDAPAVLVVGHQTDGKSALVEALMGFQFNHVGGGTKTRRPITLHMKHNPLCELPLCHLASSDVDPTLAQEKSLQEIQSFIEAENMRLERESNNNQFSAKEIIIKVEFKYCPNLTIIDTPGLIAPAPGRKNGALQVYTQTPFKNIFKILFSFIVITMLPEILVLIVSAFIIHARVKLVQWSPLCEPKCSIESSLYYVLKIAMIGATPLRGGW